MQSQQPLIQLPVEHLGHPLTSAVPQGDYSQELVNNNAVSNHLSNNNANDVADNTTTTATNAANTPEDEKVRRPRSKWTQEETDDLIKGCATHGVGNWKKILEDPSLKFRNRTSVDLKDRFRTYFPEDYKRLYPNATSTRERVTAPNTASEAASFSKAKRKERTPFTKQEDENLLIGFGKYGGKWSSIQKDESLGLSHRRSTDLRDRFRNAYPEKYVGAGFKPPPSKRRRRNTEAEPSGIDSRPTPQTFEFHNDLVATHSTLTSTVIQDSEATIPTPIRRDQAVSAMTIPQPSADTFSHTRLGWTNTHNAAAQQEREMALKIRRALDMSNPELMTDPEIPLDPGLSDVSYQPHDENQNDGDPLTGLLDAAVQRTAWKRK